MDKHLEHYEALVLLCPIVQLVNAKCFPKVPGRMGLLVTLFLISVNVYNRVEAPSQRGMSFIEIWILGTQLPILIALLEYGVILAIKKKSKNSSELDMLNLSKAEDVQKFDNGALIFSIVYFVLFQVTYWTIALT